MEAFAQRLFLSYRICDYMLTKLNSTLTQMCINHFMQMDHPTDDQNKLLIQNNMKFKIPALTPLKRAPPNTPSSCAYHIHMPKVNVRTLSNVSTTKLHQQQQNTSKRPRVMTPNSTFEVIKAQLSVLQEQSAKENMCNDSSSATSIRTTADENSNNDDGAAMGIIQEEEEDDAAETTIMEDDDNVRMTRPRIHARFVDAAEKFNANDQDHMNRLIQFTMEVKAPSRYKNNKRSLMRKKRGGIRTPARRVLANDEYLRDGIVGRADYHLDVSFGFHHGPEDIVSSPSAESSSLMNHHQSLLLSESFIANNDDEALSAEDEMERRKTVQTLALLMQRIYTQQQLAIDNDCDTASDTKCWSFTRAKEDILSDVNAKELAVTWIALTELMRNFDSKESDNVHNVLELFDEGEEYVSIVGSDAQLAILRNAREKYRNNKIGSTSSVKKLKEKTIHAHYRPSNVYSSCKTPINNSKHDNAARMSRRKQISQSKSLSTSKLAPDSVLSKDRDLFSGDTYTPLNISGDVNSVVVKLENGMLTNPAQCPITRGALSSPTANLRASFKENATIHGKSPSRGRKSDDGLSTTPLRRSKRIASACSTPS